MLCSAPGMIVDPALAAVTFYCACSHSRCNGLKPVFTHYSPTLVTTEHAGNALLTGEHYTQVWSAIVLLSMIIFVASYASGREPALTTGLDSLGWRVRIR